MKKVFLFVPLLAVVGLLFVKPPSIAHNNPLPTSSSQATVTSSNSNPTNSNVVQESSVNNSSVSTKSNIREENVLGAATPEAESVPSTATTSVTASAPKPVPAATSTHAPTPKASIPTIGGKGGDDEHEGKEHEGRERHGDDDGGRLPKPPSNH